MRIALFQCDPLVLDVAANLQRLSETAAQAASRGARLLVVPEMFLTGYSIGASAVERLAQPADGLSSQAIAQIARRHEIAIAYGYPERGEDGRLFNSAQLIDAQGASLMNYRKTHLFGDLDREQFSQGDGAFPVVEWEGWRLGLLICYDIEFPEAARRLALAGAELILVPTANMAGFEFVAQVTVRSRAFENLCYVAYANYSGREDTLVYCGQSSVSGPTGAQPAVAGDTPALLIADLERAPLTESRRLNPYLSELRPEIYPFRDN